jgi:mercuric ion binding protein
MKNILLVAGLVVAFLIGCAKETKTDLATTVVKTPTVVCGTCEKNIQKALGKVSGVKEVQVDTKLKTVKVSYETATATVDQIETAISGAGYDANGKKRDQGAYEKLDACCKSDG